MLSLILLPSLSVAFNFKSFCGLNSCPSSISKFIPVIDDLSIFCEIFDDVLLDVLFLLLPLELEVSSSGNVEKPSLKVCFEYSVLPIISVLILPFAIFLSDCFVSDTTSSISCILFSLILVSMIRQDYDPSAVLMLINKTLY